MKDGCNGCVQSAREQVNELFTIERYTLMCTRMHIVLNAVDNGQKCMVHASYSWFCGTGESSLSPVSNNSINTLPLFQDRGQDPCIFILSNSSDA